MTERIWQQFLTERDRALLADREERPGGLGNSPAFLMIDLYRGVFGDEPEALNGPELLRKWPGSCGLEAWEALPRVQSLLAAAREAGVPVIHTTGLNRSHSGMAAWGKTAHSDTGKRIADPVKADQERRKYDLLDELAPLPGEVVLRKASPSPFFGTPLAAQLTYWGTDTIVVAGATTSGCVRAGVVDGCTYRYRMVVAEECVFDKHEATHAINLFDLHQKYADILSVNEITRWWNTWQPS